MLSAAIGQAARLMCLIAVAHGLSARYRLVLAANRDEQHQRATEALAQWPDTPGMLAGRDLVAGGTWLAANNRARIGAVTNLYTGTPMTGQRSRGGLVAGFTDSDLPAAEYIGGIVAVRADYGPFNLLLYEADTLHFLGSGSGPRELPPGPYALSNAGFDDDWPKARRAREFIAGVLDTTDDAALEAELFDFLEDRDGARPTSDYRGSIFIRGAEFGTRSSSVILLKSDGELTFSERRYDARGACTGSTSLSLYTASAQA